MIKLRDRVKKALKETEERLPGLIVTRTEEFCRLEKPDSFANTIAWCEIPDLDRFRAFVIGQKAYFANRKTGFEWKFHTLFNNDGHRAILEECGFKAGETEEVMVFDLQKSASWENSAGIAVREMQALEMPLIAGLLNAVYENRNNDFVSELIEEKEASGENFKVYGVFDGAQLVSAGWMRCLAIYGVLFGGATLPAHRGRGCYKELVRQRLKSARERHFDFIMVEAGAMSRPILERLGFVAVAQTIPFAG